MELILPGRHHGLRRELESVTQHLGFEMNIVLEVDSLTALKELVCDGVAMGVLPRGAISSINLKPDMVVLRFVDPPIAQSYVLAFSMHKPITPALHKLAGAIRAEVGHALAEGRLAGKLMGDTGAARAAARKAPADAPA